MPVASAEENNIPAAGSPDLYSIERYQLPENVTAVDAMTVDAQGNVWFADSSMPCLFRFDPVQRSFNGYMMPPADNTRITGLYADDAGSVWYADRDGNRVGRFSIPDERFYTYNFPVDIKPTDVVYLNGFLWIACKDELGRLDISSKFLVDHWVSKRSSDLFELQADNESNIWFIEYSAGKVGAYLKAYNGVAEYDIPAEDPYPTSMALDSKRRLWFSESGPDRLGMFDTSTEQFAEYDMPAIGKKPVINRLTVDGNDHVWLTDVENSRLIKFFPDIQRFAVLELSTENSYPTLIEYDGKGIIWFIESGSKVLAKLHASPEYGLSDLVPLPTVTPEPSPSPTVSPTVTPGFEFVAALLALLVALRKRS
ncbi:Vgb family protein [Methanooceanicella nereidis]|nr:lyase [Methanocella sp. CWC-04]